MIRHVWIVTNTELGWDCVVGVFDISLSRDELENRFDSKDGFLISMVKVDSTLESWE